jgi:hypothetical protein
MAALEVRQMRDTMVAPPVEPVVDVEPVHATQPLEDGLVAGRPVEDRSFEVVETGLGVAAGVAIGAVVAGPPGAVIGGVIGGVAGFAAGEALERHEGLAAETTDADPADLA